MWIYLCHKRNCAAIWVVWFGVVVVVVFFFGGGEGEIRERGKMLVNQSHFLCFSFGDWLRVAKCAIFNPITKFNDTRPTA